MKNRFFILFLFTLILYGCAPSLIKVEVRAPENIHPMFGQVPERLFYTDAVVSDSLIPIWRGEINGGLTNTSVTFIDSLLFINDLSGRVFCFNSETGKVLGQLKVKGSVYTTPVLHDYMVIFISTEAQDNKSTLHFYDFSNGKFINEILIRDIVYTDMIKIQDGVIFLTESGTVYKYNFRGEEIFSIQANVRTRSTPAVNGSTLIFGGLDGQLVAVDLTSKSVKYKKQIGSSFFSGGTFSSEMFFIGNDNGKMYAVKPDNGDIIWEYDSGARITMTASQSDKNIVFGNLKGTIYSISKSEGVLNWQNNTNGVFNSPPLIAGGRLFITDLNRKLLLLDYYSGKLINEIPLNGRGKLTPVIFNNKLYIGFDDGQIQAYEFYY